MNAADPSASLSAVAAISESARRISKVRERPEIYPDVSLRNKSEANYADHETIPAGEYLVVQMRAGTVFVPVRPQRG